MGWFHFPGVGEVSNTSPPPLFLLFKGAVFLFVLPLQPFPTQAAFSQGTERFLLLHPGFGLEEDFTAAPCGTDPTEC